MNLQPPPPEGAQPVAKTEMPWFRRLSSPVLFLIVSLALVGAYLAFTVPISVFPNTHFPRIAIAVDNGRSLIDRMLGAAPRRMGDAVNSVQAFRRVPPDR